MDSPSPFLFIIPFNKEKLFSTLFNKNRGGLFFDRITYYRYVFKIAILFLIFFTLSVSFL
jgi:hypothetical protein